MKRAKMVTRLGMSTGFPAVDPAMGSVSLSSLFFFYLWILAGAFDRASGANLNPSFLIIKTRFSFNVISLFYCIKYLQAHLIVNIVEGVIIPFFVLSFRF